MKLSNIFNIYKNKRHNWNNAYIFLVKFNELLWSYKGLLKIEYDIKYFFILFMQMDPSTEMGNCNPYSIL